MAVQRRVKLACELTMHFRQVLRTQFVWTRTTHLNSLHRVCRAEVAVQKTNLLALVLVHVLLSLAAAEQSDSPGGSCGKPAELHHREVWFITPHGSCLGMLCVSDSDTYQL